MKILLVFVLSLSALHSSAASLSTMHPQRNLWRNFVSEKLPQHWQRVLVGMTTIGMLLLASPTAAQDHEEIEPLAKVGRCEKVEKREHLNVFHLVLDFEGTLRENVLVYVGRDKRQRALLLGLRINIIILPVKNAAGLLDDAEAWLFDHTGLVLQQAEVEEVQAILRPDNSLARLYDLTLLAVKNLDSKAYQAAPLATTLPLQEPLSTVAYHRPVRDDWVQEFSEAILLQRQCVANSFTPARWEAWGNCDNAGEAVGAPIFTAAGELIGFNLLEGNIVVIPLQARQYLQASLDVSSEQKLATTWANIKEGTR